MSSPKAKKAQPEYISETTEVSYDCHSCEGKFNDEATLIEHEDNEHPSSLLKCNKCDFTSGTAAKLTDHIAKKHSVSKKYLQEKCPSCNNRKRRRLRKQLKCKMCGI